MDFDEKKIYFVLSPHINYYHSYRGDSRGETGFGRDIKLMGEILDKLDEIENKGFSFGDMRVSWDYADTFWSIQLQKEFQQDILDRVIERCKKGKDEVLIGSWGNVAQPVLDTEEFIQDQKWLLENSMGIGLNQLFPGRIAPYVRAQETMFTQGMIELYNQLGIEGICIYYSVYQFDVSRPFLNPRLDWNQRYGLTKFKSAISDASSLMIPMYGFGDIFDYRSIKRWFEMVRKAQKKNDISGHALIFLNFDMDYDLWIGVPMPKRLQWMPNTRGLMEFAEAVDQYDYVEFTNLLDIIPKLKIHGETVLREDVADGNWNGFYNWTQKYNNTKLWTIGQRARWLKCISDTLVSNNLAKNSKSKIDDFLRNGDDASETYLRNKILFASTTNFGMAMPFQHPQRQKTAMSYVLKAYFAAEKALGLAKNEAVLNIFNTNAQNDKLIGIIPIINRGITEKEKKPVILPILIKSIIPNKFANDLNEQKENESVSYTSEDNSFNYAFYHDECESNLCLEGLISSFEFNSHENLTFTLSKSRLNGPLKDIKNLIATSKFLKNQFITIEFNENGKIISFKFDNIEFGCPKFLDSAVTFGEPGKERRYSSVVDDIIVIRNGSDNLSASIKILSEFIILPDSVVNAEKILTIYSDLPYVFVKTSIELCDIKGEFKSVDGVQYVEEKYDNRWIEIMPCEIRPNIIGENNYLRIWKHNYLGQISYFDLDMKEVDSKNADIGCLVNNISDGWMALSNKDKGILIGYNSLKAANFAFTPIKIKDKGFGDSNLQGQQIRINPFGTYYGKHLHYWTNGTGHGQEYIPQLFGPLESTASTYSGKTISFEIVLIPYIGDNPPDEVQSFANHFSLPPLVLFRDKGDNKIYDNYSRYTEISQSLKKGLGIEELMKMSYIEWVREVNEDFDPSKEQKIPRKGLKLKPRMALKLLKDGIKGR